jgi:hypothetical protein
MDEVTRQMKGVPLPEAFMSQIEVASQEKL